MTAQLRIGVLTSLYPTPERPFEGIFAERRWLAMAARGHDVRVVQPTPHVPWLLGLVFPRRFGDLGRRPESEKRGGITISRPRYLHVSGSAVANAKRFASQGMKALTEAEWTPQIVVCDYAWPAAVVAPLCAGQGIPCAISGRGSDVLQVAGEAGLGAELGAHLNTAGAWFAVSNDLVCAMDTLAGSDSTTRGTLVPNGVDAELFQPLSASDRDAVRREMGWGEDEWIVLLVGHLIPRKDPLLAVRAFAALQSERGAGRAMRLIVIGKGELDQELQGAIEASELSASVELLGERNAQELSRYYAAADCLLLCSKREGRPNVVLEALSSGLPVVATSAGGTAELLDPSPCPPVESRDPSDLAAAMGRVLDDAPSREAVRASVAQYSWDAGLVILERLLQDHVQASSGKIQR